MITSLVTELERLADALDAVSKAGAPALAHARADMDVDRVWLTGLPSARPPRSS